VRPCSISAAANVLKGGTGDDRLIGGTGIDTLHGGASADTTEYSLSGDRIGVDLAAGHGLGGTAQGDTLTDSLEYRQPKEGILAYINERSTNGIVEGLNNRLRTIARRAYGCHSAEAPMAMLYLCAGAGAVERNPSLPT